jgi:(E)-4-hydroxy-3-methylbut-2-enyl-diphosphate synthase
MESVPGFAKLKEALDIPLVADIHFDYRLALESIAAGADKIRINPGNIGQEHIKKVAQAAKNKNIPIRVGINSGSLEKEILAKYNAPTARALAESAFKNVDLLKSCDFDDIVVSIKASDVRTMVESYRIFDADESYPYPLHLGVTEAGTLFTGLIKSSVGIGSLLLDGIGDTIRISLTANPIEEIKAAKILLRSLGLRNNGLEVVSCPTCGRTTINSIKLAEYIEKEFSYIKKPIKIAVMGCVVNGPGEAREADLGVTGANGEYVVFKNNKIIHRVSDDKIIDIIKTELDKIENE